MDSGYKLVALLEANEVKSLAGIRIVENLVSGKFLYVDDLVTDEHSRNKGHGSRMFDWLIEYGKQHDCGQLHLDSGVQRFDAHRFYLKHKMIIASHHFAMEL